MPDGQCKSLKYQKIHTFSSVFQGGAINIDRIIYLIAELIAS
ncbi:hypothetical protein TERTU_4215 [Teredinibacter turnerae T7901]|uniref:Uncharacterized protein n=1 Tax=Teredinibacter turnerae (strain ATCC 39867 / T7901) TaxID=377629 RepID=C5BI41_TERTT|nr:hypothetical protein TERTU_4215 [Teredinibacter turnerae T7901]